MDYTQLTDRQTSVLFNDKTSCPIFQPFICIDKSDELFGWKSKPTTTKDKETTTIKVINSKGVTNLKQGLPLDETCYDNNYFDNLPKYKDDDAERRES